MELSTVIRSRYACRSFKTRDVADAILQNLFDLARNAPSASNRQEWRFVVVKDKEKLRQLTEKAGDQKWWAGVPVIIACCADTNNHIMKCRQPCYPIDIAIIIDHLTLAATDQGLGTCWIGSFDEDIVREICEIPRHIRVVELLMVGYPADKPREKSRLSVDEILFKDRWEQPL